MAFRAWREEHRPDVVVCTHPELRDWITRAGLRCPEDIGLVHLDLTPELEGWSGMRQNNDVVGAFAVDMVTGQLHRNEYGIPLRPKCMMTESEWVQGGTVRPQNLPAPRRGRRKAGT
jgi:LacI family transcriptional regulator